MEAYLLKTRLAVLVKHPSLVVHIHRGEADVGKFHVAIELERARSLFAECRRRDKSPMEIVGEFKSRICYGNAYLYAVCKLFQPKIVIETGVRRGASTAFILQALSENGVGGLYSIDLPNVVVDGDRSSVLPRGTKTGYLVPDQLVRSNWKLILGDSRQELPKLLEELESVDIFHHDSLHTYEHMLFEFQTVWSKLTKGGILLSDDAKSNAAFADFCARESTSGTIIGDSGIAIKK